MYLLHEKSENIGQNFKVHVCNCRGHLFGPLFVESPSFYKQSIKY